MSFLHAPRTSLVRPWLLRLHLCAGLSVGVLALIAGLSGAALVYAPELEFAARRTGIPVASPLPLDALARTALDGHPGFRLQNVRFDDAGAPALLHIQADGPLGAPSGGAAPARADLHLVVDPGTGAVLRIVDRRAGAWGFLRSLHHDLLAGRTGRTIGGLGAAALLLLCITGLLVWWPGPALWTRRIRVARTGNWKRANWDLHNAAGFWLAAGLAFFALSGVHFAFPGLTRSVVTLAGGATAAPPKPRLAASPAAAAGLDTVAARARAAVPGGILRQIKLPKRPGEPVEALVKTPLDGHADGNTRVYLDPGTAGVIRVDRFRDLPLGRRAVLLMESLHMARFMSPGWPSVVLRLPWVLLGLAPGLLFATGFVMWWNRVASKRVAAAVRPRRTDASGQPARAFRTLMVLAWCAALTSPAYAQRPALSGHIVDASGGAVADAAVTLFGAPDRTVRSAALGSGRLARHGDEQVQNGGNSIRRDHEPPWIVNAGLGTSVSVVANAVAHRFDDKPTGDVSAKAGSTAEGSC